MGGGSGFRGYKKLDRDGDGRVARKEWKKPESIFKDIDKDGDGYLTLEEFQARFGGGSAGDKKGQTSASSKSAGQDGKTC